MIRVNDVTCGTRYPSCKKQSAIDVTDNNEDYPLWDYSDTKSDLLRGCKFEITVPTVR